MSLRKDISSISYKQKSVNEDNCFPVKDIDYNQRYSLNSVFGEKIIGLRKALISAQFQYGYPSNDANVEQLNGGSITIENSLLTVSSGTNINGSARINNKKALRYLPGHEGYIFFTSVFSEGKTDSFQRAGLFDNVDGFFLGYEGEQFTVSKRRDSIDENISIDITKVLKDGSFDPTKGNVYKISYGYLGFATISFEVLTPNGEYVLIHKIEYPNSSIIPHIKNSNLQPRLEVANTGNTTDLKVSTGSFSAGIVNGGNTDPSARKFSFSLTNQAITAGTLTVVTFRSKTTFNGINNYIDTLFTLLSFNSDLSKSSLWVLKSNTTITNTPTWNDIDLDNSTIEYSNDAVVTFSSGKEELALPLGKVDRLLLENIEDKDIEILPGETITLFIITDVGTSGTYDLSLRWKELF